MKKLIYFICTLFILPSLTVAQCPEITGENLFRVDEINRLRNLSYTVNENMVDQMLDLYIPSPMKDCEEARLILVIHGGGFVSGNKEIVSSWGYNFARKGYYVAVINYRLFVNSHSEIENYVMAPLLISKGSRCDKLHDISLIDGNYKADKAWYPAVQDCRAALSYSQFALEDLGKKLEKLYVLGESAGAMSALGLTYGQQEDFTAFNPNLEKEFGDLNSQIKFQTSRTKKIDKLIGVSGAMLNAQYFFSGNDSTPVLFFHGGKDHGAPLCEYRCVNGEREVNGPLKITSIIDSMKAPIDVELHVWENEAHDLRYKYKRITDIMMDRLSESSDQALKHKRINVYPENALLYNCNEARLNTAIIEKRSFISNKYRKTGVVLSPLTEENKIRISHLNPKGHININILDALGNTIHFKTLGQLHEPDLILNTTHLSSGVYYALISYIDEGYNEKIKVVIY